MLPSSWIPNLSSILPGDPTVYGGPALPFWFALAALVGASARSLIHLFKSDGGAQSIATIDLSVAGGPNIVALFGQWGAIQLLLVALQWALLLRYRGLLPLVLLVLLLEPFARSLAGKLKPIATLGVAPGARYNGRIVPVLALMLYLALCSR